MTFNTGKYNTSPFNVASDSTGVYIRLIAAKGIARASSPLPKVSSKLYLNTAAGISKGSLFVTSKLPLSLKKTSAVSSAKVLLTVKFALQLHVADAISSSRKVFIKTYELDHIDLSGLVLYPNDTLIIDMDKITVERNGVNVIAFWQTGSSPFEFSNGENVISFTDDDTQRNAAMTITWRNRWM